MNKLITISLLILTALPVMAELKTASIFGDHMVLQREKPVPVWGTADAGEAVTVEFAGQKKTATADKDGKWMVKLDPMKASTEGREMRILSPLDARPLSLSDILVGEVWLGSGQSNMAWDMARLRKPYEDVQGLISPLIRFRVNDAGDYTKDPEMFPGAEKVEARTWTIMSKGTYRNCSANMFYFATKLQQELNVPVGVIVEAAGFTSVANWTPADTFNKDAACLADFESYRQRLDAIARQPFRMPTNKDYAPRPLPDSNAHPLAPWSRQGGGYTGGIQPLQPFPVRGICWDQGESGSGYIGLGLVPSTVAMVTAWRRAWGMPPEELPFIQAQKPSGFGDRGVKSIGPLPAKGAPMLDLGAESTENWQVQELVPSTYTANSMDPVMAGFHPSRKDLYGNRFADIALARCYGRSDRPYRTPVVTSCTFADGKALVEFKDIGDGLKPYDGEPLRGFFIAAADRVYFPAEAEIVGKNQVRLSAEAVKEPAQVMYGTIEGLGNLAGSDGLWAFPYRNAPWAMPDAKAVEARVWPLLQTAEPGPVQEAVAQVLWQLAIRDADAVTFLKGALDQALQNDPQHAMGLMVLLGRHVQTGDAATRAAAKAAFLDGLARAKEPKDFSFRVLKMMQHRVSDAVIKELMTR